MTTTYTKRTGIFLLLLFCLPHQGFSQNEDKEEIKNAFEKYKASILNGQGEEAIKYVDSHTLAYYADMLEKTRQADSAAVNAMNVMDKLMVLSIRHRTSREDILDFDEKALFVYAVNAGMIGKDGVRKSEMGDIDIQEDFAKAQVAHQGEAAPFYYHFYREDGRWKLDLTALLSIGGKAFEQAIADSGQEENEFILTILGLLTQEEPSPGIWQPIE